jgi:hypothetical protein
MKDLHKSWISRAKATTWLNVVLWSMGYIKDWQAYYRFQAMLRYFQSL